MNLVRFSESGWLSTLFFWLIFRLPLVEAQTPNPTGPIRVACVGNSITWGAAVENRSINCYPNQLQRLLGPAYEVHNFGVSGSTLLNLGDKPYLKEAFFREAIQMKPEILIIKLGTNDSKPQNWDEYKGYFKRDYQSLLSAFRAANPKVLVYLCLPVPVYGEMWGIRAAVVEKEIVPLVREIARENNAVLIDTHTPMANHPEWFPDKVHPNAEGARELGRLIFESVRTAKVR